MAFLGTAFIFSKSYAWCRDESLSVSPSCKLHEGGGAIATFFFFFFEAFLLWTSMSEDSGTAVDVSSDEKVFRAREHELVCVLLIGTIGSVSFEGLVSLVSESNLSGISVSFEGCSTSDSS